MQAELAVSQGTYNPGMCFYRTSSGPTWTSSGPYRTSSGPTVFGMFLISKVVNQVFKFESARQLDPKGLKKTPLQTWPKRLYPVTQGRPSALARHPLCFPKPSNRRTFSGCVRLHPPNHPFLSTASNTSKLRFATTDQIPIYSLVTRASLL